MIAKLKSNTERSKLAITLLYLIMGGGVLMLMIEIWTFKILSDFESGYMFSMEDLATYDLVVIITALLYLILIIICAVFFIMWFRRAYYNLHQLKGSAGLRYSEGWAAGAWFVPIFNLFGPYQIATDLHEKTENLLIKANMIESKPAIHAVKGWWWASWITASVVNRVGTRMEEDIDTALVGTIISMVGSIITLAAAYLAIKMIKNYHEMELMLPKLENVRSAEVTDNNSDLLDTGI